MSMWKQPVWWLMASFAALHGAHGAPLKPSDEKKVRAANAAYVEAWLKNDSDAVLATLWPDAVLIPQGLPPIQAFKAIKEFWWPAGSRTTITSFTFTADEFGGDGSMAFARGTFRFDYVYETNGRSSSLHNAGNYLMIFRRDTSGTWRISHRMWGATASR